MTLLSHLLREVIDRVTPSLFDLTDLLTTRKVKYGTGSLTLGGVAYYFAGLMLAINPDPPPRFAPEHHTVAVAPSVITVPLDIPFDLVEKLVLAEIGPEPLVAGSSTALLQARVAEFFHLPPPKPPARDCRTDEIVETVTKEVKCRDILDSRDFGDAVGITVQCLGAWGGKIVSIPVSVVKEVVTCKPVTQLIETVSPIPELRYEARLQDLDLTFRDGRIQVAATVQAHLELGTQGDLINDLVIDGGTKCDLPVSVTSSADVAANTEAASQARQLRLTAQLGDLDMAFRTAACSAPFSHDVDYARLQDVIQGPLKLALEAAVRGAVQTVLDAQGKTAVAPEQVAQALALADHYSQTPLQLPVEPPVWLALQPEVFLAEPRLAQGGEGAEMMRVVGGIRAYPELHVLTPPDAVPERQIPLRMGALGETGFAVTPVAYVDLAELTNRATEVVRHYLETRAPWINPDAITVESYQSHDRLVLGISGENLGWLNIDANLYLTARPMFDPESLEIYFEEVKVDASSSHEMTRRAAWFVEGPLEKLLKAALRFPTDPQFRKIVDAMSDFSYAQDLGRVDIQLRDLRLQAFWLDANRLAIAVRASGQAQLHTGQVDPQRIIGKP